MTRKYNKVTLAKISAPHLEAWVERKALFALLDEARTAAKHIWISAPAGAGKTVLARSYSLARNLPVFWYQLDAGDADPASFFAFLAQAAKQVSKNKFAELPLFTTEYAYGLSAFARNFFRTMFAELKQPVLIVFDNVQDVPLDSPLHELFSIALEEAQEATTIFLLSRSQPGPVFARMQANHRLTNISGQSLDFTLNETSALCKQRLAKNLSDQDINRLHQYTKGWVTALQLLLDKPGDYTNLNLQNEHADQQVLFEYITGEIFQGIDKDVQAFLLITALLPNFTEELASQLTGDSNSKNIIKGLLVNNYFTVFHGSHPPRYEYFPLFRDFLLARLAETKTIEELQQLKYSAANLLKADGQYRAAADLFDDLQDWQALTGLVLSNAREMLARGQHQTLRKWLTDIPAQTIEQTAWLEYWLAAAYQPVDLFKAREHYEKVFSTFVKEEEVTGIYLSWAGIIDTFLYLWADFRPLDEWIEKFEAIHQRYPDFPSPEIAARVTFGIFTAMMWRRPDHPNFKTWLNRAEEMVQWDMDPTLRMMTGVYLLFYYLWWRGDLNKAEVLVQILKPVAEQKGIAPLTQLMWKYIESADAAAMNDYPACIRSVESGLAIAGQSGVYILNFTLHAKAAYGGLAAGKIDDVNKHMDEMALLMQEVAYFDRAHYYYLRSWPALIQGDIQQAREWAETALKLNECSGGAICAPFTHLTYAQILLELGETQQAEKYLQQAETWGRSVGNNFIPCHANLTRAYALLVKKQDIEPGLMYLKEGLAIAKQQAYATLPWIGWRRDVMLQLYMLALEHDIEVPYVQQLISSHNLLPQAAPLGLENWPWALKIFTMGRFAVLKEGKKLAALSKSQKKPLDMLKALLALGGRAVSEARLAEALWPDADGDAAHRNFTTTLHRLRKLIGEDVLQMDNGQLSLDARYCWVDKWAFERLLNKASQAVHTKELSIAEVDVFAEKLLALYQGPFLAETSDSWGLSAREHLRTRYIRVLRQLARHYGHERQCSKTIGIYEQLLEIEDLSEELYYALMACYAGLGHYSEALLVFNRCKSMLTTVLQIEPSEHIQQLHQAILEQDKTRLCHLCDACHSRNFSV